MSPTHHCAVTSRRSFPTLVFHFSPVMEHQLSIIVIIFEKFASTILAEEGKNFLSESASATMKTLCCAHLRRALRERIHRSTQRNDLCTRRELVAHRRRGNPTIDSDPRSNRRSCCREDCRAPDRSQRETHRYARWRCELTTRSDLSRNPSHLNRGKRDIMVSSQSIVA
jgi:hypothetical protein